MRISDWSSDVCSSDLASMFSRIASFAMSCLPRPGAMSAQHHRRRVSVRCSCLPTGTATAMTFDTPGPPGAGVSCFRSEEHTSELQSLMRISYAVFCLNKNNTYTTPVHHNEHQ